MLHLGDCAQILKQITDASIDSCVTDPPYGIEFMGAGWDSDVPPSEIWREVFRVLKPGGHLLAFAGTRTHHRMATRIEESGFEIRDLLMWVYGSGFPKSHNLDGDWNGWGTALKPALEPITLARKPMAGTVAANVQDFGTGALNVDGCRVPAIGEIIERGAIGEIYTEAHEGYRRPGRSMMTHKPKHRGGPACGTGRWPANLIHDGSEEVLAAFPIAPGQQGDLAGHSRNRPSLGIYGDMSAAKDSPARRDSGSAARFFYCAKASKADRDHGLTGPEREVVQFQTANGTSGKASSWSEGRDTRRKNHHPTVKPTDLMRYLCRLITPPGGVVLDPFMGSGSTGRGAVLEGFGFVGIEREGDFLAIARDRIDAAERAADEATRQGILL
ncbi:site-specific DNA-methyltransferase [Paracoccus siganidrum]|uniref:Methyltransferase n=2 Tax=Paracoccus siganidrum TaxID=1276757 RepID=A0A419A723_9RHOB|nr:site-specific DNA-methyltransferase [Paracoccus siganidrum]RMC39436.1 site-specific DNA-methyltransferase [Paracoccus siganidrum]